MDPPRPSIVERRQDEKVSLFDYWDVIVTHQRLIGILCGGAILMTMIVSLLLPKIYESTAVVLPQSESKETGGLATLLAASGAAGMAQNLGMNVPGFPTSPTDTFVSILKSRVMADDAIAKFDLMDRYGKKTMVETREKLADRVRITVTKEKVVKVVVEDEDPTDRGRHGQFLYVES